MEPAVNNEYYFDKQIVEQLNQTPQYQDSHLREALAEADYEAWLTKKRESENP
jgi:hypothetical protein